MTRFRNLDSDGAWRFGKGLNDYVRNVDAVALDVKTRLQSWLKDCFFAQDEGINWKKRLGSKDQRRLLEQDIKTTILQTDNVAAIISLSTQVVDRKFTATYNITTTFSESFEGFVEENI